MKYVKLMMVVFAAISLLVSGCGSKKSSNPSPTEQENETTKAQEITTEDVVSEDVSEITPEEVEGIVESVAQQDQGLSKEEIDYRLSLDIAYMIGGIIFIGNSFPLERLATRIQARALFLSNIAILDRAQQKRLVGLQVRDTLPKRAHGRYMQTLRMEYKRLEGWKIGDSWKSTLREDAKRKTLNIMKQEVAEKVSKIEAQANRRLLRAKVLRGGAKFLSFGARGMRYVLGPLAIAFGATEMIRLLTSEASNSELTAEDRLLDFEKSVRTYRHDPESIGNQKALVEASAASLPDIISAVEHKVDVQKEVLSDIEKSEDLSAEDKEVFKHAAEIELGQAKKSLKSHQAALDLITSGNDASDESLEKLKIQTEKFLQ